jgi:hypothetical protein
MPEVLAETFTQHHRRCPCHPGQPGRPGYFAPKRVDEFVVRRIAEAVVHGNHLA